MPTLFLLGTHGWSLSRFESQKKLKHTGMFLCTHVRSNQQDGRTICGPHGDEGVGYENELSKIGQSRVGAYQTVPRHKIVKLNVIIDVLGGEWSKDLDVDMRFLERDRVMFSRGCRRLCYPAL